MNFLSIELVNSIAADYVVGLQSPRVRRRVEHYRKSKLMLDQAISYWEGRFAPLILMLPSYEPSDRVWLGIQEKLHAENSLPVSATTRPYVRKKSLWERLTSIDFFGGALSGAVTALLLGSWIVNVINPAVEQPQTATPTEPTVTVQKPGANTTGKQLPASYVGALTDNSGKPRVVISSLRHGKKLDVKILGELNTNVESLADPTRLAKSPGKLYLWGLRDNGEMIRVGKIPASGNVQLTLPETSEKLFADVNELAVTASIEEPAATGVTENTSFVVRGPCAKVW